MIRQLSLIVILSIFSLIAKGQQINIEAGFSLSKARLTVENAIFDENKPFALGFHIGVTKAFPINDKFFIETGLTILSKEDRNKLDNTDANGQPLVGGEIFKLKYLFIQVPIKFKTNIGEDLFIEIGPTFDYTPYGQAIRISSNGAGESSKEIIDQDASIFKQFNLGAIAEIGYNFGKVEFGLRYNFAFPYKLDVLAPDVEYSINVIALNIAYPIGRLSE